jgi:aspartyl protease family protein
LKYQNGQPIHLSTANGVIPAWRVKLASLRVGEVVVYDVDAVVSSGTMPYVLLGNSFLSRFQITRTNDQMVLDKRF